VTVNGKLIFSKKKERRFPELDELKEAVSRYLN
jgi:predicted Rdx family selenoprotein